MWTYLVQGLTGVTVSYTDWGNIYSSHDISRCIRFKNKRSMELGALLDTCNWCDKWQISTDLFRSNMWSTKLLY